MRTAIALGVLVAIMCSQTLAARADEACIEPDDPSYQSYDCRVQRLRARNFVVIALVDTGINPYHADFQMPASDDTRFVPPWEYIDGYPRTAKPLRLTYDAPSYEAALARDSLHWKLAKKDALYYLPGSKVIGAYSVPNAPFVVNTPILDENGHGTATASVAAGAIHGSAPDKDVLIVSVQGLGPDALRWATTQPWIDIVSNSWQYSANLYYPTAGSDEHKTTKTAVEAGKVVAFAAGNGAFNSAAFCNPVLTTTSPVAGPPWVLTVGAVSPRNGQAYCWHSIPPDVASYGLHWPAAAAKSLDGEISFGGTSNATPVTAGVVAAQVLEARRTLSDSTEGPHAGGLLAVASIGVTAPASGPLADGKLTNEEAEEITIKTAFPVSFDAATCEADPAECINTVPTTPAYFLWQGYGIVNQTSKRSALDVLVGKKPLPDRSDVDRWMAVRDAAAAVVWSNVP